MKSYIYSHLCDLPVVIFKYQFSQKDVFLQKHDDFLTILLLLVFTFGLNVCC